MKVKYIKLENFQSHKKRVVKFSPSITTIVGPSDKGKSAILRALGWVCLNNFSGNEFIREGEKSAAVKIKTIEDGTGTIISREKSSSSNAYFMEDEKYASFGQGVPDDIKDHLKLSSINFQSQHEAPFWFSQSAGEVSRQLNSIVDLTIIDSSMSHVGKVVRENETKIKLCEERETELQNELKLLNNQRLRIDEFKHLKELLRVKEETESNHDRILGLVKSIRSNTAKRDRERCAAGTEVLERAERARGLRDEYEDLLEITNTIDALQKQSVPRPPFGPVAERRERAQELHEAVGRLKDLLSDIGVAEHDLDEANEHLAEAEHQFHEETDNEPCPLCGTIRE